MNFWAGNVQFSVTFDSCRVQKVGILRELCGVGVVSESNYCNNLFLFRLWAAR
jgi:hypothetical protein